MAIYLCNPANKQTNRQINGPENNTSLAEVIMNDF